MSLNESIVEDAALEWFGELGYGVGHGLVGRLREAIRRLNPAVPEEALHGSILHFQPDILT